MADAYYRLTPADPAAPQPALPSWAARAFHSHGQTYHHWDVPTATFAGPVLDYHLTEEGANIVSPALRGILEQHKGPHDWLEFLPMRLATNGQVVEHFVLHCPYRKEVYEWEADLYANPTHELVGDPELDDDKVEGLRVFAPYHRLPEHQSDVLVHPEVKTAIEAAGLSGIGYVRVAVD